MNEITLGIIEDHNIVLESLRLVFESEDSFNILFASNSGREGLDRAVQLKPDILILDVRLPDESSVKIAQKVLTQSPQTKIICLSSFDSIYEIIELMKAGISAYVLKDVTTEKLFKIIKTVYNGGTYIDERLTFKLFEVQAKPSGNFITTREAQIIYLASFGKSNKEIASELGISEDTVKTHISKIIKKLGANNRTEAVVIAIREGIISDFIKGKNSAKNE